MKAMQPLGAYALRAQDFSGECSALARESCGGGAGVQTLCRWLSSDEGALKRFQFF